MSDTQTEGDSPSKESELPPKKRGRKSEVKASRGDDVEEMMDVQDQEEGQSQAKTIKKSRRQASPPSRGIMASSDTALRRRDKIKSTERYSPPPEQPKRRSKARFPSTMSSSKNDSLSKKGRFSTGKEAVTVDLNMTRDSDGKKMLITLPDGTTYRVDATPVSQKKREKSKVDQEDDDEEEDLIAFDDQKDDDDYRPTPGQAQKLKKTQRGSNAVVKKTPTRKSATAVSKLTSAVTLASGRGSISVNPISKTPDGMRTTAITARLETGKTAVTYITTPKSVSLSPALRSPPKKMYGNQTRFIDQLPDLADCVVFGEAEDKRFSLLPDKILLVYSELPLQYIQDKNDIPMVYAFRQVINTSRSDQSVSQSAFQCLLCPKRNTASSSALPLAVSVGKLEPGFFKTESELKNHYNLVHELHCEVMNAVIPGDIVFVCLDKKLHEESKEGKEMTINSECQYCDCPLVRTLSELKDHYHSVHEKKVSLVPQESVLRMTRVLHCYSCQDVSFDDMYALNDHVRKTHSMTTYPCKSCVFFTREPNRLKSHYKAKHTNSVQCLECGYCNGVLMGKEPMNRHIMTCHSILTSNKEYSCQACLQVNEHPEDLVQHTLKCPALRGKADLDDETREEYKTTDNSFTDTACFLCDKEFESPSKCRLHLDHVHTQWVEKDKTEDCQVMKVSLLPSVSQLQAVGVTASQGFYCFICDVVIKAYPLFYLHMYNVHGRRRMFQCKVSSCGLVMKTPQELKQHLLLNPHPQKSVIEDPLGAVICHLCDMYFMSRVEFEDHHLSDGHDSKLTSEVQSYSLIKNYKCSVCHTWFSLRDSLIDHMTHESHRHPCPYCGIDFALHSSLRTHLQSYHADKSDQCEVCGQKHTSKERLMAHLVTHNIMAECIMCTKKFYQKEQLNSHNETHKPAIDCLWSGCQRKILPTMLSMHIKQHRRQNKCCHCDKLFTSQDLLDKHLRLHEEADINAKNIIASSQQQQLVFETMNASKKNSYRRTYSKPQPKRKPEVLLLMNSKQPMEVSRTEIPQGLKIMCNDCNQLLMTQEDIQTHKCPQTKKSNKTSTQVSDIETASAVESLSLTGLESPSKTAKKLFPKKRSSATKSKNAFQEQPIVLASQPHEEVVIPTEVDHMQAMPQYLVVQNEDGSMMQIEIPVGVDLNQLLGGASTDVAIVDHEPQSTAVVVTTESTSVDSSAVMTTAGQGCIQLHSSEVNITITEEQLSQMIQQQF